MKKTMIPTLATLLLSLLLTCALAAETDAPQLQRLKHSVVSPSSEQVVLQLNGSYSPKVFTLKDQTPRIVFDFAGMTHGREIQGVTTTNGALVKRIRVGMQTEDATKTRIVFDLATLKGVTYSQKFDERTSTLTVRFTGPAQAVAADNGAKRAAAMDKKTTSTTEPTAKRDEAAPPQPAAETPLDKVTELSPPPDPVAEAKPEVKPEGKLELKPTTAAIEAKATSQGKDGLPPMASAGDKVAEQKPQTAAVTPPPPAEPVPAIEAKPEIKPATALIEAKTASQGKDPLPPMASAGDKVAEQKPQTAAVTPPPPAEPVPAIEAKPEVKPATAPIEAKTASQGKDPLPPMASAGDKVAEQKPQTAAVTPPPPPPQPVPAVEAKPEIKPEVKPATAPIEAKIASQAKAPLPPITAAGDKAAEKKIPTVAATPPPAQAESATAARAATTKPALLAGPGSGPQLESVTFDRTSPKGEMVLFKLNDFHPPVIHGVEEGVPRVICDFNNTQLVYAGKNLIKADGKFVKLIRITRNKKPDRVRVVLDLEPNLSYDLQQVFFKEDNLFVIIVNTVKK